MCLSCLTVVVAARPGNIKGRLTPTDGDTTWRLTVSWSGEEPGELSSGRELGGSEAMMGRLLACHAAGTEGEAGSGEPGVVEEGKGESRRGGTMDCSRER